MDESDRDPWEPVLYILVTFRFHSLSIYVFNLSHGTVSGLYCLAKAIPVRVHRSRASSSEIFTTMEFIDPNSYPPPLPLDGSEALQVQPSDIEDGDIFRGEPPPRSTSHVSLASSSSSSDSSFLGGRFTAIATVVELAISRWARTTSSSSDGSSSQSSIVTLGRPRTARRRRRSSSSNLHNIQSERDLAARFRAREESRHIPREFVLYLPPPLNPQGPLSNTRGLRGRSRALAQQVSRTSSLPLILGQLEIALKKSTKARRSHRPRARSPERTSPNPSYFHQDYMLPDSMRAPSRLASFTDLGVLRTTKKGRNERRLHSLRCQVPAIKTILTRERPRHGGWMFPVLLGKTCAQSERWAYKHLYMLRETQWNFYLQLLHLHPLTLEDILQQDPREKLELFPRLGYYFVSFRAIESRATRERFRRHSAIDVDHNEYRSDGGAVGEVNVYLVVFREGICSVRCILSGDVLLLNA